MTGSVLTFGEPLVVCVPKRKVQLSTGRDFELDFAGAELNTAIGLSRLEVPVAFAATVGDDPFGRWITRELRAEGVDITSVQLSSESTTGLFFKISSNVASNPDVYYYRSASPMGQGNWDSSSVKERLQRGNFTWVHSTGITWMLSPSVRIHAQSIIETAQTVGVPVSFDVNLRRKLGEVDEWRRVIDTILPTLTWLFVGDDEANTLWGENDACKLEGLLRSRGFAGRGLVVKRGAQGATGSIDGNVTNVPAWPVMQVVDTVGAGDGFNAGWIAGMQRGMNLSQAMTLGSIVGAFAVASSGDSSGYPSWRDARDLLDGRKGIDR